MYMVFIHSVKSIGFIRLACFARTVDKETKNELRKIFNKHDPIGIYFTDNFDEYDPEIERIVAQFRNDKTLQDFLTDVYDTLVFMFDKQIVGAKSKYKKLTKEIYEVLKKA